MKFSAEQLQPLRQRLRRAKFMTAAHEWRQLPPDQGWEIAFAGRSNVGKSSVINRLCDHGGLARTSRTPGRTQQIVYFDLEQQARIADLPGYGYAKVPEDLRRHWGQLMNRYFTRRVSLSGLVIIMDIRHPLTEHDQQMLAWTELGTTPCHVVLNKADKLSRNAMLQTLNKVRRSLPGEISVQSFSASKGEGQDELLQVLQTWLERAAAQADDVEDQADDEFDDEFDEAEFDDEDWDDDEDDAR